MALHLESSSADTVAIDDEVAEVVLSVQTGAPATTLRLGQSVQSLQLTGHGHLPELILHGGHRVVAVTAASDKQIGIVRIRAGLFDFSSSVSPLRVFFDAANVTPAGIQLATGVEVEEFVAPERLGVSPAAGDKILATPGCRDVPGDSNGGHGNMRLSVGRITSPEVALEGDVTVEVSDWLAGRPEGASLRLSSSGSVLRVTHRTPEEGVRLDGPDGELQVVGALMRRVSGQVGRLSTSGPAVVHGTDLKVRELRCDAGAKISGLSVGALDLASLDYIANATSFDVEVPTGWKHSWSPCEGVEEHWRQDSTAWRLLYEELERKGQARSARWARTMELETRRRATPRLSTERAILESARLLGYGESVVRPLAVQATVCAAFVLLLVVPSPLPSVGTSFSIWPLFIQLLLAPLWLVNSSLLAPPQDSPRLLLVAWFLCAFTGSACFGTAALAVRRLMAYGKGGE